jgi:cell fate (sporulation/competence/biofilm development) regulator YmcA (YheA/YmcA/DUF963 family)
MKNRHFFESVKVTMDKLCTGAKRIVDFKGNYGKGDAMEEAKKLIQAAIAEIKKDVACKENRQAISHLTDALVLIDRRLAKGD